MCEPVTGFQCGRAIWISHPLLLQFDTCNSLFSLLTILKFSMKTIRHVKVNHWFIRHNFTAFKYLERFYTAVILFKPTIIAFSGWNTLIDSNVASCERVGKWVDKETQCVVFLCQPCRWLKTLIVAVLVQCTQLGLYYTSCPIWPTAPLFHPPLPSDWLEDPRDGHTRRSWMKDKQEWGERIQLKKRCRNTKKRRQGGEGFSILSAHTHNTERAHDGSVWWGGWAIVPKGSKSVHRATKPDR